MRKITDIYKEYKIMEQLQLHQLRVAAVAKVVADSLNNIEININNILTTCLLHDMGNIIKFKLDAFPEFNKPEGLEYWSNVQQEYIKRYGTHEHKATSLILKELGISEYIISLSDAIEFDKDQINTTKEIKDFNRKVCCYADMRVGPFGIISVDERLADGKKRYANHKTVVSESNRQSFEKSIKEVEKQIFEHSNIKPEDINDKSVAKIIEELKNFEI